MNKDLLHNGVKNIIYIKDYDTFHKIEVERSEEQINKLKELSLKTEEIFKEMYFYRIVMARMKKIKSIWK